MKPAIRNILISFLILIGAYSMGADESWAYNFTVNSTDDAPDANPGDTFCRTAAGKCTLRAAIQEANSFPIFHSITVPKGTFELTLGELLVTEKIYIYGSGQGESDTVIDGKGASRILRINGGVALIINNMRLRNGSHTAGEDLIGGGAVYNQGELEALNVTFVGNNTTGYGGATFSTGDLTLNYCTFIGNQSINGGALYSGGTADIFNVNFDGNNAGSGNGGAIYNDGTLKLEKSTLMGSTAGHGGGIYNNSIIEMANDTISGNSANGSGGSLYNGTLNSGAQATLLNVTISSNNAGSGGGLFNNIGNTIILKNTIVAGNTPGNCLGSFTSNDHNLENGTSCGLTAPGDLNIDPLLGQLTDNGGPTWTHYVDAAGAKNVGTGCPITDQRGYPRETAACDIGAYEETDKNPFPAITTLDPNWKQAGTSAFILTVNGYTYGDGSFVEGKSVVLWNGSLKETTFETRSKLTAKINADDLLTLGPVKVTVFNPATGGGTSNEVIFTVTSDNPKPTISGLSPDSRPAGGPSFTLTVNGSNFLYDALTPSNTLSVVLWNGIARPTSYVNPSQLTADIPAGDIQALGTALITVSNSPPSGGISDPPAIFTIGPPILYLPLIIRN
jgi:CSLREA domain-containing protein